MPVPTPTSARENEPGVVNTRVDTRSPLDKEALRPIERSYSPSMIYKHRFLALAVAVTTVTALIPAASGQAEQVSVEPAPVSATARISPSDRAVMAAQAPLSAAAEKIRRVAVDGSGTAPAGYAGITLDDDHVTVWWKGAVPSRVAAAVTAARDVAPVEMAVAAHSRAELTAAAATAMAHIRAGGSAFSSVEIAYNGRGLVLNGTASASRRTAAESRSRLGIPAGIDVKVRTDGPLVLQNRVDDPAPFQGGSDIHTGNLGCTSGFSVANSSGTYLLTAGHCGDVGSQFRGGLNQPIGTATAKHRSHDLMLISAPVEGKIWFGGARADAVGTLGVGGWAGTFPGEFLCREGVYSGTVCNYRVSDTFQWSGCNADGSLCVDDLVIADQLNGTPALAGDSGGPLYVLDSNTRAIAKGTFSGHLGENRARVLFQDFETASRDFGINVIGG